MGLLSKPKPPPVADYTKVAGQQTQANTDAMNALYNLSSANQVNPYGKVSYYTDPVTGKMTANQQFSPEQQQLLDYLQGTQGIAGSDAQQLLGGADYDTAANFGDMASGLTHQQLEAYDNYNKPYFDQEREVLDNTLRNQGLVPGDKAYDYQTMTTRDRQADQRQMAAAKFEPQAWQQAVEQYKMPAQMATALAQFGSPASMIANIMKTPEAQGSQGANFIGANANMNTANMERFKQQMATRGDTMKAISQIGGGLLLGPMGGPLMSGLGGIGTAGLTALMGTGSMGAAG